MRVINVINVRKRRPWAQGRGERTLLARLLAVRCTVDGLFVVAIPPSLAA